MGKALTSKAIGRDALGYWQEVVCGVFVPLECRCVEERFDWSILSEEVGDARFADLTVSPHTVRRTRLHIGRGGEHVLVGVQLEGRSVVRQDGREAVLLPGDFAIYDSTRPYELHFPTPMRQRILRLPREAVTHKIASPERLTALAVSGMAGIGALFRNVLDSGFSAADQLGQTGAQVIVDTLTDLLAAAMAVGRAGERAPAAITRHRMLRYIEANLADPGLSVGSIAAALGVSTRYAHLLLRSEDTTLSRFVWRRRLERCAEALADPAQAEASITQIAFTWGFSDAAHFSRAFKGTYGSSPREFRRGSLRRG